MSKRHLVEDLSRVGVNEWAVMRALMVMTQRGEIIERAKEEESPESTDTHIIEKRYYYYYYYYY